MNSRAIALPPETITATAANRTSMPTSASPLSGADTPMDVRVKSAATVPIMKISECAKLMSRSTP